MWFLGLDVGGANIKAAALQVLKGETAQLRQASKYFPIWKQGKEKLPEAVKQTLEELKVSSCEAAGVTMTAELSDVYESKREGVTHVLEVVSQTLRKTGFKVVSVEGRLIPVDEALRNPLKVASANWAASGWLLSRLVENAILCDVGSTTTSIIPVKDGRLAAKGLTDLEKLALGELVYTGALRTSLAAIVKTLKVRGTPTRISAEYFASTGDVYLALKEISPEDYTVETPDGRGKSLREALARLARTVCADLEAIGEKEALKIALQVAEEQQRQIAEALNQVYQRYWGSQPREGFPIVTAGVKGGFLAAKSALKAGFRLVKPVDSLLNFKVSRVLPAAAAAYMAAWEALGGFSLKG